ncbi:MAG: M48 family metalloprotease [Acidobacteriaceae bacterium]|nr:M48 family metalloprotease [Acidobacteriaceae bacterium]MBV9501633.1 M48 family metalloprotease [Acidobacteriaceae bacterium]
MSEFKRARLSVSLLSLMLVCTVFGAKDKKASNVETETWKTDPKFDLVLDKIANRESQFVKNLRQYSPMVETYIQNMRPDKDLAVVPVSDEYFLGRIKLQAGVNDVTFLPDHPDQKEAAHTSTLHKIFSSMQKVTHLKHSDSQQTGYMSDGFAQMIIMDMSAFDRQHYEFRFMRREFLGDVRTLVIDVKPKLPQSQARFIGRIWAEDQQYNVVRFNGTYTPQPKHGEYLHFDSWRLNMGNDQWLPAYVYSEETDLMRGRDHWDFRAQTLLWGYDVTHPSKNSEYTDIAVDSTDKVKDESNSKQDLTAVEGERAWQRQAEDNVLERMQRAAFLAPEGPVDKVLNTVVQNLEITNKLDVEPEVRCRVLLTQPMESFTVGHTIVVSRGLLDALPDEASLAVILAHEMGHILSSHQLNEKYAFSDRMIFPDEQTVSNITVRRTPEEEKEADTKALQLLQNSPYKDKLPSAGLFLAAMKSEAPQLPHLLKGEFGNPLDSPQSGIRMGSLTVGAPALRVRDVNQIAALPLGGRIRLDSWSDQITIQKTRPVHILFASEKMAFQITPMFPYLTRGTSGGTEAGGGKPVSSDPTPSAPSAKPKPTETSTSQRP